MSGGNMSRSDLPWIKEYRVLGIRKTLTPYPDKPVYAILEEVAKKYKKNGLIQNNFKMTYSEVVEHVNRLATAFHKLGLEKGDRVVTLLPTSIQFIVADYAISRAGLVHIPASSLEPPTNLRHKFMEGAPLALICLDEYLDVVQPAVKKSSIEHLIVTRIDDYSNNIDHTRNPSDDKYIRFMDLIRDTSPMPPNHSIDVEKDLETLLFTGGTTGLPKGCMLTHRNIYANTLQNFHSLGQNSFLLRGAISVLLGLPFFHSYGHMIMHTMTMLGWNQILVNDPRDTKSMIQMIKDHKPMVQIGVPTQFMKLCDAELKCTGMLGLSGSAPLPPSAQEAYEKKTGSGIMEGYGLSEMSPVTHLNTTFLLRLFGGRVPVSITNFLLQIPGVKPVLNKLLRLAGPKLVGMSLTRTFSFLTLVTSSRKSSKRKKPGIEKRGTIGIPFPDTEIRIVDIITGEDIPWDKVAEGMRGEMLLRGPQRMLGYWPTPGQGLDENGYIHTSDIVKVDERGYFYIVDRTKDMIIVSGFKVYSREIDDILFDHEAVEIAATVGIPDPEREGSERVIVYLQPKAQYKNQIDEEQIISYLREKVAKYAVPKKVFIVDKIPLTEVQKIDKKQLKQIALEDCKTIRFERVAANQN
jgi:acyl-CoA synthetase (AMP-forming)/AMP-acid ligase II